MVCVIDSPTSDRPLLLNGLRLVVLCGPPGAGKSTYALTLPGIVLSADALRLGQPAKTVFERLHANLHRLLREGRDVILDVCALHRIDRDEYRHTGRRYRARCELHILETPLSICRERDAKRRLHERAQVNWLTLRANVASSAREVEREGWDAVVRVRPPCQVDRYQI